jgi:hypothetical protein
MIADINWTLTKILTALHMKWDRLNIAINSSGDVTDFLPTLIPFANISTKRAGKLIPH